MDPNNPPLWQGGDAPDKEKMDQIRARRLAKLASSSQAAPKLEEGEKKEAKDPSKPSSSSSTGQPSTGPATPRPTKSGNSTPATTSRSSTPTTKPFSKLNIATDGNPPMSSSGTLHNQSNAVRKRPLTTPVDEDSSSVPKKPTAPRQSTESLEDFTNRVLSQIFRLTVDPHNMTSSNGHRLAFLPDLNSDIQRDGEANKLTLGYLDQAILEAATSWPHDKPLMHYFLPCWKRACRAASTANVTSGPKHDVYDEAKRLAMSHCLFSISMPVLYGREQNPNHDTLAPYMLKGILSDEGLDMEFYKEAIKRLEDDDTTAAIFDDAMVKISTKLGTLSMNDNYKPYMDAILTCSRFPVLLANISNHATFNMAQSAAGFEKHTFLGPFFRISPLQGEVVKSYFPGSQTLDKTRIANAQDSLRMVLKAHQDDLFAVVNAFIRASPETRGHTLDWFASIINANHKRRAMQVDPREVASDGFMMNITTILDRFCEPFMDNSFSKIDKIDVRYFRRKPRVDISDETKINADQAAASEFYADSVEGESNFISEIFFLTLAAHHYGSEAANSRLKDLGRQISHLENSIKYLEAERPKISHDPVRVMQFDTTMQRYNTVLDKTIGLKYAIEGVLLDEGMQSTSLRFMRYVAVWILRLATNSDYKPGNESESIKLPLPIESNKAFACLPEYCLLNIVDNFKFVFKFLPKILLSAVGEELIALCITLLRSSEYIKNPFVKSSLVTLLFSGTWPFMHLKRGVLGDQLVGMKFANDYLLHALMKFYIECESTGANSAFYDKFNIRYEIFQVIKCVWVNDVYKEELTRESKLNKPFFVRFVNMLLNDATYVLDEALTKLSKIRTLEEELKDSSISQEDRQKKEEELQTSGSQATSYMQLANETLEMMKLFTGALAESFTMPEIVTRLASMLNYNLETLAGPKANSELSVKDKEKYHFRPLQLLRDFVEIYLNLDKSTVFINAVAADGRSYRPAVLQKVSVILNSRHQMDTKTSERWDRLRARFDQSKGLLDQAELDLGEIPSEFEDPIMGDLMSDPVLLPSGHIVDRSTIAQHLLSDAKDPFTRQPMTIDDVVPAEDLKVKIEGWRSEKVGEARERLESSNDGGAMDTRED